ncbi:MAG: PA0069 family radical SAM protein [Hyphomicrobiales bacterium]|nr:PA0069 family radical SAM protein [Hyphomicrobiales bacterium]
MRKTKYTPAAKVMADAPPVDTERRRGRGACSNAGSRYDSEQGGDFDDGWETLGDLTDLKTEVIFETAKRIITTNDSPDISFDQSINAYRGCEHGCIYCYARPTHSYLGFSAGLDFETKLIAKINAAEQLERELAKPGYVVKPIMLGSNTDPYQPIEREQQLTRRLLEVFDRTSHPVGIVTKSALVLRDIDLLASLASRGLTKVALSITTLDHRLARRMEPRASTPMKRVDALRRLSEAGVPTVIMTAPIIPVINDHEIEALLATGAQAGARQAAYVLVRLPLEISPLFQEWLTEEFPDRAKRVMSLIRSTRGGKDYVSDFGERQTGAGVYGAQIARRYRVALQKHGLNERRCTLRCDIFQAPVAKGGQFTLFQP